MAEGAFGVQRAGFDLIARTFQEKGMLSDEEVQSLLWQLQSLAAEAAGGLDSP